MGDSYSAMAEYEEDLSKKELLYQNAIYAYIDAMKIDNTYIESYISLAKVLLKLKDFAAAEFYLKRGIERSYRHYTWLERDTSWSYEPWDLLCLASYYNGNKKDSIIYAAKALSFDPNNERLKNNLSLCLTNTTDIELIN